LRQNRLRVPATKEIAMQLISSAENSSLNWKAKKLLKNPRRRNTA
jgi:hypothetical protein